MDYKKIYSFIYSRGYHKDLKNHGIKYVDYIVENYSFSTILEVGCSQGMAVKSFIEKGKYCKGIDVSSVAIKESEKTTEGNCIWGSVLNIPFKDKSFNAVFSSDVLEHLEPNDVPISIKEIKRVSTQYLFLKIAFGKEINTQWADLLQKTKGYANVKNLHLTVKNKNWWIDEIEDEEWEFIEDSFKNLMVFKQRKNNEKQ